ncbi:MAG TPA: tRNA (adenosine(37)-N6)-threonylcarbamoyltransferase complex dimerization subunit type 1 TsaB [Candidatus Limnocylindria bacterium]|nr:tRNA (adenosine(37)-N6)-threonylcarbamoyltransferase complex dimerization subunit type 1 TsaB [Candidatus Limnocylindria bacterium]
MTRPGLLLALDTATRTPVLGLAGQDGTLLAQRHWASRHRHGEQLLTELDALLDEQDAAPRDLAAIAVGLGPGSFTGLRIGLATAKTLAHALDIPLAGVSTTRALALAAGREGELAVSLPAGVADRYVHRLRVSGGRVEEDGPPQLTATAQDLAAAVGPTTLVAVDLPAEDVGPDAVALGETAVRGLAAAIAGLGSFALSEGRQDDVATLVPAYVALPRGIARAAEEIRWSPDLR